MTTVHEVAEKLIAELTVRGWCQGRGSDEAGRVCLSRAYDYASAADGQPWLMIEQNSSWLALWLQIGKRAATDLGLPAHQRMVYRTDANALPVQVFWNDFFAKTQEDVILLIKNAAADFMDER